MKKGEEDGRNEKRVRERQRLIRRIALYCTSSVKRSFLLCLRMEMNDLNRFIAHLKCQSLKRSSFRQVYIHAV